MNDCNKMAMEELEEVKLPPSAPPYATLMLDVSRATEKLANHKDVEEGNNVEAPLVANSFAGKKASVVFIQKVLSIFLLQTLTVDIIMETILYFKIFKQEIDFIRIFMAALVLFSISLFLMLTGMKARRTAVCNYIILIYQPIGLTIGTILMMRALMGVGYFGEELLEMICRTWKSCVFSGVGIMIYSIFCLDTKHGIRLVHSLFIATGVFASSYLCSILWYANKYPSTVAFTIFYINLVFYPIYLYVLYDIDAMTRRDYRAARDSNDYVNGAANLQMDFIFIIINFFFKNILYLFTYKKKDNVSV